jgi:hypothetical protein
MGPVCELDILPDLGQLHTVTAVMDAPAPGGIPQREHNVMLPAD